MKFAFTGDIFLGGDLNKNNTNIKLDEITDAKTIIGNLEQAISKKQKLEGKCTVFSSPNNLRILNKLGVSVVNLANNHIHDNGLNNIVKLKNKLHELDIQNFGGGKDIEDASQPLMLKKNLYLLGYCDYGKSYLNKVKVATENSPGVNGLSGKKIIADLQKLPVESKAILYLHWGRENVLIPPLENIKFSKKLLENPQVHSIIGMHPHKIQGHLKHNGKYAFFSLGNFLFPNFYYMPRTYMVYPTENLTGVKITKEYHPVFSLTYKKWRLSNRISFILELDLETGNYKKIYVKQLNNEPKIRRLNKIERLFVQFIYGILSLIINLPSFIYAPLQKIWYFFSSIKRYLYIFIFYFFKDLNMKGIKNLIVERYK